MNNEKNFSYIKLFTMLLFSRCLLSYRNIKIELKKWLKKNLKNLDELNQIKIKVLKEIDTHPTVGYTITPKLNDGGYGWPEGV